MPIRQQAMTKWGATADFLVAREQDVQDVWIAVGGEPGKLAQAVERPLELGVSARLLLGQG